MREKQNKKQRNKERVGIMRKKIVVGNWKMNMINETGKEFLENIKTELNKRASEIEVAFCVPYTLIDMAKKTLKDTYIKVGAQNVFYEPKGAYTGEISLDMLKELDVFYCLIGHSERRMYFAETDETVNLKLLNILNNSNIIPIICVGESLEKRQQNQMYEFVANQIEKAFKEVTGEDAKKCVIAYEPIWAIGTGINATTSEAEEMCKYIREKIEEIYGQEVADVIRIQYGGSANATNSKELLSMQNIDGLLVGGASLKEEFVLMLDL